MSSGFVVRYTDAAKEDLGRLSDYLLDRAETVDELGDAQDTINVLTTFVESHLSRSPFIYRKVGPNQFLRELIVPVRTTGYVVLYEIEGADTVNIPAVRHQLEDDYS